MIDRYIQMYGRRLYGLCLTLMRSPSEADDLYQETWLKVLRHIDQYDSSMDFEPWLTKICVNTYRSTLRRRARSPFTDALANNEEKERLFVSAAVPEEEDYSALYDAIDRLPEKLRTAVILFYFREMDLSSAAAALNVPIGTVKSRLNKARKRLKEVLSDETDLSL